MFKKKEYQMFNNQEIHSKFKVIWNVTFINMICVFFHVYVFLYWINELFFSKKKQKKTHQQRHI